MHWNVIEEQWKVYAGSARAHWSKLTNQDWQTISGKKEQLVERIQDRYEIGAETAEKQIADWSAALLEIGEVATHK